MTIYQRRYGTKRVFAPFGLLWALIGLILTIGGTWLEAFVTNAPWNWSQGNIEFYSLGVNFQVGAVLFTGCMGGRHAAALSQIAYLSLGLFLFESFGFQVFTQGGGLDYLREPSFGYLLGFVPAGWVCGALAFRAKPRLERLVFSCLSGLAVIHLVGLVYLVLTHLFRWGDDRFSLLNAIASFSVSQIPGQVMIICAVSVVAYAMRRLMFY